MVGDSGLKYPAIFSLDGFNSADDPAWPVPGSLLPESNYPAAEDQGFPRPTPLLTAEISP